jgi:hypothetical protein
MAITHIGTASSVADGGSAGTSGTITPPTMQAGDLVVVQVAYRATGSPIGVSETGGQVWHIPDGWTTNNPFGITLMSHNVFWCVFNGNWSANPIFRQFDGTLGFTAVMHVFRPDSGYVWNDLSYITKENNKEIRGGLISTPSKTPFNFTLNFHSELTSIPAGSVAIGLFASADDNTWALQTLGWDDLGYVRNLQGNDLSNHAVCKVYTQDTTPSSVTTQEATLGGDDASGIMILFTQTAVKPSVIPDTPDLMQTSNTTPDLEFTGSQLNNFDLGYQIQIHTDPGFDPATQNATWGRAALYSTWNASTGVSLHATSSAKGHGARLISRVSGDLDAAFFWLALFGTGVTGNVVVRVYADDNNSLGALIATSSQLDVAPLTTAYTTIIFQFTGSSRPYLREGTYYWIFIEDVSLTGDGSNYLRVGGDGSSPWSEYGVYALSRNTGSVITGSIPLCFAVSTGDKSTGITLDKNSYADSGFTCPNDPADLNPFYADNLIRYTVQSALSPGTYYWRARAKPSSTLTGVNPFSDYSVTRSFTITQGGGTKEFTGSLALSSSTSAPNIRRNVELSSGQNIISALTNQHDGNFEGVDINWDSGEIAAYPHTGDSSLRLEVLELATLSSFDLLSNQEYSLMVDFYLYTTEASAKVDIDLGGVILDQVLLEADTWVHCSYLVADFIGEFYISLLSDDVAYIDDLTVGYQGIPRTTALTSLTSSPSLSTGSTRQFTSTLALSSLTSNAKLNRTSQFTDTLDLTSLTSNAKLTREVAFTDTQALSSLTSNPVFFRQSDLTDTLALSSLTSQMTLVTGSIIQFTGTLGLSSLTSNVSLKRMQDFSDIQALSSLTSNILFYRVSDFTDTQAVTSLTNNVKLTRGSPFSDTLNLTSLTSDVSLATGSIVAFTDTLSLSSLTSDARNSIFSPFSDTLTLTSLTSAPYLPTGAVMSFTDTLAITSLTSNAKLFRETAFSYTLVISSLTSNVKLNRSIAFTDTQVITSLTSNAKLSLTTLLSDTLSISSLTSTFSFYTNTLVQYTDTLALSSLTSTPVMFREIQLTDTLALSSLTSNPSMSRTVFFTDTLAQNSLTSSPTFRRMIALHGTELRLDSLTGTARWMINTYAASTLVLTSLTSNANLFTPGIKSFSGTITLYSQILEFDLSLVGIQYFTGRRSLTSYTPPSKFITYLTNIRNAEVYRWNGNSWVYLGKTTI